MPPEPLILSITNNALVCQSPEAHAAKLFGDHRGKPSRRRQRGDEFLGTGFIGAVPVVVFGGKIGTRRAQRIANVAARLSAPPRSGDPGAQAVMDMHQSAKPCPVFDDEKRADLVAVHQPERLG